MFFKTARRIYFIILMTIGMVAADALPQVKPYTPDFSGEYVYYRDNSFTTTSFIGFLYYNESTYAARYYAPADNATQTPEKDITIYVTLNPEKEHLEFTGERVVGSTNSDSDTQVINYLQDLLYELTSRRQKVEITTPEPISIKQDFMQFGGIVTITFNPLVPIFNISAITAIDDTPLLQIATTGLLTSSSDTSFAAFKGMDGVPQDKPHAFNKARDAQAELIQFNGQSVTIDSMWTHSMGNLWLLGDSALLSLNTINRPALFADSPEQFHTILLRQLTQSTTLSYAAWPQLQIKKDGTKTTITNVFYQSDTGNVTRDIKIITDRGDGSYSYFTLTVYDSVYQNNRIYFSAIIKSYTTQ